MFKILTLECSRFLPLIVELSCEGPGEVIPPATRSNFVQSRVAIGKDTARFPLIFCEYGR